MAMENDKIKDLFASKLKDFEPEVPASVWGGLDQLLSQQPVPAADPSSTSSSSASSGTSTTASAAGKTSLIKTVLITIGVAAAVVTGVLVVSDGDKDMPVPEEKTIVATEPDPVIQIPVDSVEDITPTDPIPARPKPIAKQEEQEEPIKYPEQERPTPEPEKKKEPEKPLKKEEPLIAEQKEEKVLPKPKAKGFSLSLSANAGLLADNKTENGGNLLFSVGERSEVFVSALEKESSEFKLQHSQPVSFGIKVSKGITQRLSLETGLVYTYLSSKIKSESVFGIKENQSFHYLGIPVSLNYSLYKLGKADIYLSVGGMIQKDISGKYESSIGFSRTDIADQELASLIYYNEPYFIREKISQSKPQFSVHTRLGISYPLYKRLHLYGTVGGAYYFDAHNKYRTIFSDRKTQFDLNLGVKFDF